MLRRRSGSSKSVGCDAVAPSYSKVRRQNWESGKLGNWEPKTRMYKQFDSKLNVFVWNSCCHVPHQQNLLEVTIWPFWGPTIRMSCRAGQTCLQAFMQAERQVRIVNLVILP